MSAQEGKKESAVQEHGRTGDAEQEAERAFLRMCATRERKRPMAGVVVGALRA